MRLVMLAYTRTRPSLGTSCDQPGQARLVGHATRRPGAWASGAHIGVDQVLRARVTGAHLAAPHGATRPSGPAQGTGITTGNTTVTRAAARSLRPFALWGPVPDPLLA
ncbi:hypothetical protein [Frankia sp. EAN1pec]|uniref:hypothetical protein n=1 Tax=Parafrankia sp. (strain EAN1pec) TaxID=298653 RepID=UPI0012FB23B2